MGFKANESFLEKLTMGATAARAVIDHLREAGFSPIELERTSTSNKLWTTKVKRLRLPDLLCVRTGLRVEVRGKSDLQIKMSDSPANPDRAWDAGLGERDLIAFVPCDGDRVGARVRASPTFFEVADLRSSVGTSRLGPPKSASEGSERDRTWPSIVPSTAGQVASVDSDRLRITCEGGRRQTYSLRGKQPYVRVNDRVDARNVFLAGTPPRIASLADYCALTWNPLSDVSSETAATRYAAAKALGFRDDLSDSQQVLDWMLGAEADPRVALEIAGALARVGSDAGFERLRIAVLSPPSTAPPFLRMEALLILAEIGGERSAKLLYDVASERSLVGNELRQAAVWGLGKRGCRDFHRLSAFLDDAEDDVALHAISAFDERASPDVVRGLVERLRSGESDRGRSSASEALRLVGTAAVAVELARAVSEDPSPWLVATLGRLPASACAGTAIPPEVVSQLESVRLLSAEKNWLIGSSIATDMSFLSRQTL